MNLPPLTQILYQACQSARGPLHTRYSSKGTVKDPTDVRTIASMADTMAEAAIMRSLSSALDCRILSEEAGQVGSPDAEYLAIVDPLDGSLNYLKDAWGLYAVSIGLVQDDEFVAGAIYLPRFDQTLLAQKGKGAFLVHGSGEDAYPVKINAPTPQVVALGDARICIGRGSGPSEALTRPPLSTLIFLCSETVNYASCSVGLASVALGKIDALVLPAQARWDFAAGYCILNELGCSFGVWDYSWDYSRRVLVDEQVLARAGPDAYFDIMVASNEGLFWKMARRSQ